MSMITTDSPTKKRDRRRIKLNLRHYKSFTFAQKTEMYLAAQNKIPDIQIMAQFNCDEDTLLDCINDVFVLKQKSEGYTDVNPYV